MGAEIQDLSEKGRENYAFPKKKNEKGNLHETVNNRKCTDG